MKNRIKISVTVIAQHHLLTSQSSLQFKNQPNLQFGSLRNYDCVGGDNFSQEFSIAHDENA